MARFAPVVVIALTLAGCSNSDKMQSTPLPSKEASVLKLAIFADGTVLADGQKVDFDELASRLTSLKESNGVVWYYRESGTLEPHPNAMRVVQLVIDNKLPISLSSKADFSDVIGPDGDSRPR